MQVTDAYFHCHCNPSVVFTFPALLPSLCTQTGPWLHHCMLLVTLLACSCKPLHCGVPGCVVTVAAVYVLVFNKINVTCYPHALRHQHVHVNAPIFDLVMRKQTSCVIRQVNN